MLEVATPLRWVGCGGSGGSKVSLGGERVEVEGWVVTGVEVREEERECLAAEDSAIAGTVDVDGDGEA